MCVCTNTCLCGNNLPAWTGEDFVWARQVARKNLCARFATDCEPDNWLLDIVAEIILADGERKPVDVDLVEARKLCAETTSSETEKATYLGGKADNWFLLKMVKTGIKRGRELEKEGM